MLAIGLIALPISKTHVQKDYKDFSAYKTNNNSLYHLEGISPEAIYNYGDKIPSIKTT